MQTSSSAWVASHLAAVAAFVLITGGAGTASAGTPSKATLSAWQHYVEATDARIRAERHRPMTPLAGPSQAARVWEMESPAERVTVEVPGATVNYWRGRIFVPHADLAAVLARVRRAG